MVNYVVYSTNDNDISHKVFDVLYKWISDRASNKVDYSGCVSVGGDFLFLLAATSSYLKYKKHN